MLNKIDMKKIDVSYEFSDCIFNLMCKNNYVKNKKWEINTKYFKYDNFNNLLKAYSINEKFDTLKSTEYGFNNSNRFIIKKENGFEISRKEFLRNNLIKYQYQGIDSSYYGKDEYGNDEDFDGTWGIWDEPFFQFSVKKMDQLKEPFMSTIFSVSSHEPFIVPSRYKNKFPKGDHPLRETIGYTDMALRNFFEKAKKMNWFKRTLFVITGDHASISYQPEYKTSWGNMSVPILFYHPSDSSLKKVENKLVQHIDIMPSVLSYLNYDKPFVAFGENIFSANRNNIAVNYHNGYQLFKDNYLLQMNGKNPSAIFDYIKDPMLKRNLINSTKPKKDSMENIIKAFMQQYHNRLIDDKLVVNQ